MIYELKAFQADALEELRDNVDSAQHEYLKNGKQQVISLTAPTGSGKTIIATSLIEDVLTGNEAYLEEPDTIFVWVSDSPELNEQSKLKIERTANRLKFGQCVTIDADSFNQEFLEEGYIYFINTQKLSKSSRLVKGGDGRDYTIWDTFQNTIEEKGDKLIVIIDEAHRGMKDKGAKEATTTMQKFIKGSEADGLSPFPIVVGMSATSARFNALVGTVNATMRPVNIPPSKVAASGLLKDDIKALYPKNVHGRVDMAVLQAATDDWQKKCDHWENFYNTQKSKRVDPIFLVQVENGTGKSISNTDLDEVINTIEERLGRTFNDGEIVHAFGEKTTLTINGRNVRYEEPARIEGNKDIKVVLFKDALSTGWDCPRAETMISFRKANDATYIAQLLGRMFRTPLAQRVTVDEYLNSVYLFLPYFNKENVEKIIKEIKEEDGGLPTNMEGEAIGEASTLTAIPPKKHSASKPYTAPSGQKAPLAKDGSATEDKKDDKPVADYTGTLLDPNYGKSEVHESSTPETLAPSDDKAKPNVPTNETKSESHSTDSNDDNAEEDSLDRLALIKYINDQGIISYEVRKIRISDYLRSLFRLAGFLHQTGLYAKAVEDIKEEIASMIADYVSALKKDGTYDDKVEKLLEFSLSVKTFDAFGGVTDNGFLADLLSTTDVDIDRQFRMAEKQLKNEGVGNKYGQTYATDGSYNGYKIDVIMFVNDAECMAKLEKYAEKKYHDLVDTYRPRTKKMSDSDKDRFRRIINDGDAKSRHLLNLPTTIDKYTGTGRCYSNHLYIDYGQGCAVIKLNTWEEGVLREEEAKDDFVCFLRNPDRRKWALCIPYEKDGYDESMYPDFLIIRKDGPYDYFIDILEPHDPSRNDNLGKAKGLAKYVEEDGYDFGRVQLIRQKKDDTGKVRYKRLDMSKHEVRTKVRSAASNDELDHIFDALGFFE